MAPTSPRSMDPAKKAAYDHEYYRRPGVKERQADLHLQKTYGISREMFDEMLASQGGVCAVCREERSARWHIDHNHGTGEVRAILCHQCNVSLGLMDENPDWLRAAAEYLEG